MRYRTVLLPLALAAVAANLLAALVPLAPAAGSAALSLGPRLELKHPGKGHELHLSGVAVAAMPDGGVLLTWGANEGQANRVYVARMGAGPTKVARP